MVYTLAVLAALLVGTGTAIEQRAAAQAPPEYSLSPRLLGWLVRQPRWLAGVGCTSVGNVVFATALGAGSVAVVEAVYILRLLVALTVSAAWGRHRISVRDGAGALAVGVGLTGFLVAARPSEGVVDEVSGLAWVLFGGPIVVVALALAALARQARPVRKAVVLGLAAGSLFALQASLVHTAVGLITGPGIVALFSSWQAYAVVTMALLAMVLEQSAYGAAPLPASYPAVVTTELLGGIALATWLLGGSMSLHPVGITFSALGIAAMVAGIYVLTTSPVVTGQVDRLVRRQEFGLARQVEARLERELRRADRDLRRTEARLGSDPSGAPPRRLQRELDSIESGLERLAELHADIRRHRDVEHERSEGTSGSEADEFAAQDRELREHERVVDERARQLRDRASRLTGTVTERAP
ncbi:MAG: DMT family transporter [Pseudonocardiaceae bacterium]